MIKDEGIMEPTISKNDLANHHDFEASRTQVLTALYAACASPPALLRFAGRYASWNGLFGSAVATLAGKIGRCWNLFTDQTEPVAALADRSVLVASFFFDAARDEFDDRDTTHRDSHRCLAQAFVSGVLAFTRQQGSNVAGDVAEELTRPVWLRMLMRRVRIGYGDALEDDHGGVFRAIGYHLGSEVLADQEFSLIDEHMRREQPELVSFLQSHDVAIAGQRHNAYQWLRIHSGHGGAAEMDHFRWAIQGFELALRYAPPGLHGELKHQTILGFEEFARDHREFFERVNE